ncbi:MAG: proline iminopeptidase-family hydrolase [Thermoplasmata archaeon]
MNSVRPPGASPQDRETAAYGFQEGFIDVMGFRLFYRSYGEPRKGTVLCVRGGAGGTHVFDLSLADLAQFGYRVVFYDQLGCGLSDRPKETQLYRIERAAQEANALREALDLGKVHLWGGSMGGALVIETAVQFQQYLKSITSSGGWHSSPFWMHTNRGIVRKLPAGLAQVIETCEDAGDFRDPRYLEAVRELVRRRLSVMSLLEVQPWEVALEFESVDPFVHEAYFGFPLYPAAVNIGAMPLVLRGSLKDWDRTEELARIRIPALITVGRHDTVPVPVSRKMAKGIPGSRLVIFENSGHMPWWEERAKYMALMKEFLGG